MIPRATAASAPASARPLEPERTAFGRRLPPGPSAPALLQTLRWVRDPLAFQDECFRRMGWPIYTFGFGDSDDALLRQIATNTGGEFQRLPTSDLVCAFQGVRSKIAFSLSAFCVSVLRASSRMSDLSKSK